MTDQMANVTLNGVSVGSMKRAEYDAIRKLTRSDKRLYAAYAWEFIKAMQRMGLKLLENLPVALILFPVGLAVLSPSIFAESVAWAQTASPEVITDSVRGFILWFLCVGIITVAVSPMFGFKSGFQDPFEAATNRRIRVMLNQPATGDLSITFSTPEQPGALEAK